MTCPTPPAGASDQATSSSAVRKGGANEKPKQPSPVATPRWERVVIFGVGLLGGSLGMDLRRLKLAKTVVGLGRDREKLSGAKARGCIDEYHLSADAAKAFAGADLVVMCQPVTAIVEDLGRYAELIADGAIVTDVGSTKRSIVAAGDTIAKAHNDRFAFVGSHPMAGGSDSGYLSAREKLYAGATCYVTLSASTSPVAAARIAEFWRALEARVLITDPDTHDKNVAVVSHIPHLVAVSLVESLAVLGSNTDVIDWSMGPNFRRMTKVAKSGTDVWRDICSENREQIVDRLGHFIYLLEEWRDDIQKGSSDDIVRRFNTVREVRNKIEDVKEERVESGSVQNGAPGNDATQSGGQ